MSNNRLNLTIILIKIEFLNLSCKHMNMQATNL